MTDTKKIVLADGKYTFFEEDNRVKILRYGEIWRGFDAGDNAIMSLFQYALANKIIVENMIAHAAKIEAKLKESQKLNSELTYTVERLREKRDDLDEMSCAFTLPHSMT